MRNKGFTLIELLAVILILGVIALIAIPTISLVITDAKKGALKSTVQNLVSAAETKCQTEQMKGSTITKFYVFGEDGVSPKLDVKGDMPSNGSIALNDECEAVASLTDGNFTVKKNLINEEYAIENGNSVNNSLVAPINNKTKVNDFYYMPYDGNVTLTEEETIILTENGLYEFVTSLSIGGFNYMLDSDNNVLGGFTVAGYPNSYTREIGEDYASRYINILKSETLPTEIGNITMEYYYYISDEYIFIMVGIGDIKDPTIKSQTQSSYEDLKENPSPFQHLEIVY